MCGIAGFIGVSKNPQITHQIATKLFEHLEVRGKDAAGFWGSEPGDEGAVVFHKEPGTPSKLIKQDIWAKTTAKMNLDLMVMHSRSASAGSVPTKNKNNHPFTSHDRSIALVHNGKLPEHHDLRKFYETHSDTDSEVLLRIFEWAAVSTTEEEAQATFPGIDWITASKVMGLKKIFASIKEGYMAAAVAERLQENGGRNLWLFRNQHRPLHIIDVRDRLGQIFFCSTDEIWRKALGEIGEARRFIGRRWIVEVEKDEIWQFATNNDAPVVEDLNCKKFDVTRSNVWRVVEEIKSPLPVIKAQAPFSIISILNENEELTEAEAPRIAHKKRPKPARSVWYPIRPHGEETHNFGILENSTGTKHDTLADFDIKPSGYLDDDDDDVINRDAEIDEPTYREPSFNEFNQDSFDVAALDRICNDIERLGRDIRTTVENKLMEGSMTQNDFQDIIDQLESNKLELEGTLTIAEN